MKYENEEFERSNPAIFLAQAEVFTFTKEKANPDLHLKPLDY